jgi:hypothetical protein
MLAMVRDLIPQPLFELVGRNTGERDAARRFLQTSLATASIADLPDPA